MSPGKGDRAKLVRRSGDHYTLVRANALNLLLKDLDQLPPDRVLVELGLYDHQERHAAELVTDGRIEVIGAVSARDFLMDGNAQVAHRCGSRPQKLPGNKLLELTRGNLRARVKRGRPRDPQIVVIHASDDSPCQQHQVRHPGTQAVSRAKASLVAPHLYFYAGNAMLLDH